MCCREGGKYFPCPGKRVAAQKGLLRAALLKSVAQLRAAKSGPPRLGMEVRIRPKRLNPASTPSPDWPHLWVLLCSPLLPPRSALPPALFHLPLIHPESLCWPCQLTSARPAHICAVAGNFGVFHPTHPSCTSTRWLLVPPLS